MDGRRGGGPAQGHAGSAADPGADPLLLRHDDQRGAPSPRTGRWLLPVAVVCLGVLGVVGLVLRSRSGDELPGGAGPLPAAPAVDAALVSATATGSEATAGLEITVETGAEVLVGTRASAHVTIRNAGPSTFHWQAGGCAIPAVVVLAPQGAYVGSSGPVAGPRRVSDGQQWDGTDDSLSAALAESIEPPGPQGAVPDDLAGAGEIACAANSLMQPLAPGDVLDHIGTFEVRVPPGAFPDDGRYEIVAAFTAFAAPEAYPGGALPPVVASVPVAFVDDPARAAASIADIADAVVADGRLAVWFETTVIPGRPDLDQRAHLGVTWWRSGWEVWVRPHWGSSESVRIRVDPESLAVVDARVVHGGAAPADEPGATAYAGNTPDEVLLPVAAGGTTGGVVDGATAEPAVARAGDPVTISAGGGIDEACDGLVIIYAVTDDGLRERGVLLSDPAGSVTWHTAPPDSPITIPPCRPDPAVDAVTFTLPDLTPGNYSVCLTRESGMCAELQVAP